MSHFPSWSQLLSNPSTYPSPNLHSCDMFDCCTCVSVDWLVLSPLGSNPGSTFLTLMISYKTVDNLVSSLNHSLFTLCLVRIYGPCKITIPNILKATRCDKTRWNSMYVLLQTCVPVVVRHIKLKFVFDGKCRPDDDLVFLVFFLLF